MESDRRGFRDTASAALFPLLGFVINSTLGRRLPKRMSGGLASGWMLGSFAVSAVAVWQLAALPAGERVIDQVLYTWFASDDFTLPVAFRLDPPAGVRVVEMDAS